MRAFIYNDAIDDVAMEQLARLEEYGEHYEEPEYKRIRLEDWDLNTLVYVLEMDISHEEKWLRDHPNEEPAARVLERERKLLDKIKYLMEE